jgi:hypothetical protein
MSTFVLAGEDTDNSFTDALLSIFRLQLPEGGAAGFCVLRDLSAASKVYLEALFVLSVAPAMAVVTCFAPVCARLRAGARSGCPKRGAHRHSPRSVLLGPEAGLLAQGYGSTGVAPSDDVVDEGISLLPTTPSPAVPCMETPRGSLSKRARLMAAAVNTTLTMSSTLTVASVKLLRCVHVPGTPAGEQRLFLQADTECQFGGWQLPFLVLLAVLLSLPVLLPFFARWAERAPPSPGVGWVADLRVGARRALVEVYSPSTPWWEAVLLVQRLVRVLE